MTANRHDWRDRAACIGLDPELFFPIGGGRHAEHQIAQAKKICARCPALETCRDYAIDEGYEGVWGGQDDRERRRTRQHRLEIEHQHRVVRSRDERTA